MSENIIYPSDLKILLYPNPILRNKSNEVVEFNDELKQFCEKLSDVCYKIVSLGLSAPQVGLNSRIFVINKKLKVTRPTVFINPVITNVNGESIYKEGCVSLPNIFGNVKRFNTFDLEYQDVDGNKLTEHIENTSQDIFGTIVQHEVAHLNGELFIDKLSSFDKDKVIGKINKLRKI